MKPSQETLFSRVIGRTKAAEVYDQVPSPRGDRVSQSEIRSLFADVFEDKSFIQANATAVATKKAA